MHNNYLEYLDSFKYISDYYGGSLPDKFSKEDQYELLQRGQAGNYEAQNKLVESYLPFIIKIARSNYRPGSEIADLFQVGIIGCIKAIRTFNLNTGYSFGAYADVVISNEMRHFLRSLKLGINIISLNDPMFVTGDGNEAYIINILEDTNIENSPDMYVEDINMKETILEEVEKLPKRDREIIEYHFGLNGKPKLTQSEIGKMYGFSQTTTSRLIKSLLSNIRKTINLPIN